MPEPAYDPLVDLGIETEDQTPDPLSWVENISTELRDINMFDLPSSATSQASRPISARIPEQWHEAIRQIREAPGTALPEVFRHNSAFFRWCVARGIQQMYQVSVRLKESGDLEQALDPTIQAMAFVDRAASRIDAEARTINRASDQMAEIARAVVANIRNKEETHAADLLVEWVENARELDDPYWQNLFSRMIVTQPELQDALKSLILGGYIVDDYIMRLAFDAKIIDFIPTSAQEEVHSVELRLLKEIDD